MENWVVSEVLEARLHTGLDNNLSCYRDRSGHEIDLLLVSAGQVTAVEEAGSLHGTTLVPWSRIDEFDWRSR